MRNSSALRHLLLVLSAVAWFAGCSQRPGIVVVVPDVPQSAATLKVRASDGNMTSAETPEFDVSARALGATKPFSFSFGLHPPDTITGTLSVGVAAFDANGCLLTSGSNDLMIDLTQPDLGLDVQLDLTQLNANNPCKTATPAIESVVQPDSDPTTLQVYGWGFDPKAQVTVNGQPVQQIQLAHWDRMTVVPVTLTSPSGAESITVAVINPDGSQDSFTLVVKTLIFSDISKYTTALDTNFTPFGIRVGDLNKDKISDVVVAGQNGTSSGFIAVFLNPGNGQLPSSPLLINLGSIVNSVEIADMDNDGSPDIVASTGMPTPGVSVYKNPGNGMFSNSPLTQNMTNGTPDVMAIGDLNGS